MIICSEFNKHSYWSRDMEISVILKRVSVKKVQLSGTFSYKLLFELKNCGSGLDYHA